MMLFFLSPVISESNIQKDPARYTILEDFVWPVEKSKVFDSAPPKEEAIPLEEPPITKMTDLVQPGDTPSTLLEGHLSLGEIYTLCDKSEGTYSLSKLRAGQPWTMVYSKDALIGLEYEIDTTERLVVSFKDEGYSFQREPIPYETESKTVAGTVTSSLFGAVKSAGEEEELAVRLGNIFAYDVDFVRDLREGDTFSAVVEKKSREGKFCGYSAVQAASFTNQGTTFYAFRYTDKKGRATYYDEKGQPLRKAFLKAPLKFTRISSGYSMSRMHPILKYRRPHQGIDYAAPTGTPIHSVADGIISRTGFNKSQGRFVCVIHRNGYETIYNHMSKFNKRSKKGVRVKQGDTIGYVGSTGYATGPHLDYRMKKNGVLINPLTIKNIPAAPIPTKELPAFKSVIAKLRPLLDKPITLATKTQLQKNAKL